MLNKLHKILKDPECKDNIQCLIFSLVIVVSLLCLTVYGFAWLNREFRFTDTYVTKGYLEVRINESEKNIKNLENSIMPSAFKGKK